MGPGSYTVCESVQAGWTQTFPNGTTANPPNETIATNCVPPSGTAFGYHFTAQSGVDIANNDFGNFDKVTKSGQKWVDNNGDGIKNGSDAGLPGWTINLYNSGNTLIQSKVTDGSGNYSFDPVGPGTYTVCESVQAGWTQTFPNGTTANPPNETIATNCVPPSGTAFGYHFTAQSGVDLANNDFGNFELVTKSGEKFDDVNGNGTQDPGDNGLSGWTIQLYDSTNTLIQSKVTDGSGNYSFDPVGPGSYTVCEVLQAGWTQTFPNGTTANPANETIATNCVPPSGTAFGYHFTAQSGVDLAGNDFGNTQGGSITIRKIANPQGAATFDFSVTPATVTPSTFTLDDDGNNSNTHSNEQVITDVVPGTVYTVTETPSGGYDLAAIDCSGGTTVNDLPNNQVAITFEAGQDIVCTFTNTQPQPGPPTLEIVKQANPTGPATFSFTATGGITPASFVLDDNGNASDAHSNTQVFDNVVDGHTYVITETPTSGFTLSAINCTGAATTNDLPNHQVSIVVQAGDSVVCTFVNDGAAVGAAAANAAQVAAAQVAAAQVSALAFTGSYTAPLVVSAVLALLLGAMLVLVGRRRRKGIEV